MNEDYEFTIMTKDGCPHCATATEGLKEHIDSGRITVLDVMKDPNAMKIAEKLNITAVPSIIVRDKATELGEVCELRADLSGAICKKKEVDF